MSGSAVFLVNSAAVTGAVAVTASTTVDLELASTTNVRSVAWSIVGNHAAAATNPTITPAGSPSGATASFPMPSGAGQAYNVQCIINGGRDDAGRIVAEWTFRAIVGVVDASGYVPFAVGETTERSATHGTTEQLNAVQALLGGDATAIRGIPIDASVAAAGAPEDTYGLTYSHGTGFVLSAGGSGGGYATIQNNGTPVTTRTVLNLPTGCGLVAADDTVSKTTLTVSGLTTTHLSASANIAASQIAAGAAGTVLVGGSPNSFSASPSVTSLTASSFVAAGGGTLADAGAVRMSATSRVANRNNGNTANNTTGWTSDVWDVSADATKLLSVGASTVAIEAAATLGFAAGITSPTITQAAAADAAGQDFAVRAQDNNSAASAAGNLVLGGGVNAGAGADGVTRVMYGSVVTAEFGAGYLGLGTAPGSGTTAHAATGTLRGPRDFTLYVRNNGDTADVELLAYSAGANQLTVASNSVLTLGGNTATQLRVGGSVRVSVSTTAVDVIVAAMRYNSTVVTPAFGQSTTTGASATGQPFEVHAQDCSGTTAVTGGKMTIRSGDATGGSGTRNGGAMLLRAGRGATSDGNMAFHADPASWNGMGRGLFVGNRSAAPTGNPADGGYLYAESGDIYWRSSSGVTTQLN